MTGSHDPADLTAHALGLLDETEAQAVERHLAGCQDCRREWEELRETSNLLGDVPPEMFLDGPPDGDLVLQRALWQVRGEKRAAGGHRRLLLAAAAAVTVLALAGGGLAIGRATAPDTVLAQPDPARPGPTRPGAAQPEPAQPQSGAGAPEQSRARTVEGSTGPVELSAVLTPAAGWVRVAATVRGVPPDERCVIVVVAEDGREEVAGSWLSSAAAGERGTTVNGSAVVAPDDVAGLTIRNEAGQEYISVPV